MTSISNIKQTLDQTARSKGFSCKTVSWEDASRGTVGGNLSCWGPNISDVRLWEKSGQLLYTLRSDNWNERLGYVAAKDVALVVGNEVKGGNQLENITLQKYLDNVKKYGGYTGLTTDSLSENQNDQIFSIRFQTVFLPLEGQVIPGAPEDSGKVEFCTDVYNYNTHSDDNPRNLLLLCNPQGTSLQQDGSGTKKMYHHNVDERGTIHRYWLEAERSEHKVGGEQKETEQEKEKALSRGKSTVVFIGTQGMGKRFNVQMMVQLPVKQKIEPKRNYMSGGAFGVNTVGSYDLKKCGKKKCKAWKPEEEDDDMDFDESNSDDSYDMVPPKAMCRCTKSKSKVGTSNAARVSRGSEQDTWSGLNKKDPVRDPSQHGTITVTLYYTVVGGVPSEEDILASIEDLNQLYRSCASDKNLVDCGEITKELTVKDTIDIEKKLFTQPYSP